MGERDPFGDVLPATSRDESAEGWGDRDGWDEKDDDRLRDEVPPHHG